MRIEAILEYPATIVFSWRHPLNNEASIEANHMQI